jgi:hypothetical protein
LCSCPARTTNLDPVVANLDPVVEAFDGMQLCALEDRVLGVSGPLNFDYASLGHQLHVFLGPRPTQEDLHHVLFSHANVTTQLSGGEPLSPEIPASGILMRFPFGLRNVWRTHITSPRCLLVHTPQMASSWG